MVTLGTCGGALPNRERQSERFCFRHLEYIDFSQTLPAMPENLSKPGIDFLQLCFKFKQEERPSAAELLNHPFLAVESRPRSQSGAWIPADQFPTESRLSPSANPLTMHLAFLSEAVKDKR